MELVGGLAEAGTGVFTEFARVISEVCGDVQSSDESEEEDGGSHFTDSQLKYLIRKGTPALINMLPPSAHARLCQLEDYPDEPTQPTDAAYVAPSSEVA